MYANPHLNKFPLELVDRIIDYLHNHPTLRECSLVSKSWVPSSRFHLFGQNNLVPAATSPTTTILELLLARKNIDVNQEDYRGNPPLVAATNNGRDAAVKLLLLRDDIDVNQKDDYRATALASAAARGNESIHKLLLEREDVDVNSRDIHGYTALMCAAFME